jgi:hypothetical protein
VSGGVGTKLADDSAGVIALPAQPDVRVLDLLRAIDGAALAGDLHAVRRLVAAAAHGIGADVTTPGARKGNGKP